MFAKNNSVQFFVEKGDIFYLYVKYSREEAALTIRFYKRYCKTEY